MKSIVAYILCALLLSGCLPLAFFANGSGSSYKGLSNSWGTYTAGKEVDAFCLSPKLRLAIWDFEGYFGKKVIMQSGFRDEAHNAQVGGADNSYHKKCMAADFYIPEVPKEKLIAFAMRNGMVGGLGCYPGRKFIHVDVRDRPRGRKTPVTFSGC